jgi:hypothetical protein
LLDQWGDEVKIPIFIEANIHGNEEEGTDAMMQVNSTDDLFLAGLWRDRHPAVANAPAIVHGTTTLDSRYLGLATNPFSRGDAEREWALIGQSALWSNLTDEP